MSFGCERSCSSPWRVSNFNGNVPQGGIYPHVKFERDLLNIVRVRALTSSGSMGERGGDAKTIISPNTSFDDIIKMSICLHHLALLGDANVFSNLIFVNISQIPVSFRTFGPFIGPLHQLHNFS